jgi:hypothetical protein
MENVSKGSYLKMIRNGASIALAAAIVVGVSASPASAQGKHLGWNKNGKIAQRGPANGNNGLAVAEQHGYRAGLEQGQRDRASQRKSPYQQSRIYRDGRGGYDRNYGSESYYQDAFRRAYQRGYEDGWANRNSYGSYGNNRNGYIRPGSRNYPYNNGGYYGNNNPYGYGNYGGGYYSNEEGDIDREEVARRAAQQGYYDGYQRGVYDRSSGSRRPNPMGHGAYQHGFNGFNPEWGSAQTYRQYYQQYFLQGHQAGFGQRQMDRRYQRRWW